jgi:hypothetical protein
MPLSNQTIELLSHVPGHRAFNSAMIPPAPSRGGFNQACQDIQPLWVALNERLAGNHFLALAAMFSEYMQVVEASFSHDRAEVTMNKIKLYETTPTPLCVACDIPPPNMDIEAIQKASEQLE